MDQHKRLLIALALSFVVTAVFMMLNPPPPPPETPADPDPVATRPAEPVRPAGEGEGEGELGGLEGRPPPGEWKAPPARELVVPREQVDYRLSTHSAGLVSAEFKGPKMREQRTVSVGQGYKLLLGGEIPDAPQMDMARPAPGFPASLAVGVHGQGALSPWATWELDEAASGPGKVVFFTRDGPWEARKTVTWPASENRLNPAAHGYEAVMTLQLRNVSSQPAQGELSVHYARGVDGTAEQKASLLGGVGNESKATCYVNDSLKQYVPEQGAYKPEDLRGPVHFVGVDQQYFLGAVYPADKARDGRCELHATTTGRVAVGFFPISVEPGATHTERFGIYVGPKDTDLLEQAPSGQVAAALDVPPGHNAKLVSTVNFGIWEVLCVVLLAILKFFHGVFGNWGIAIVLLTLTVKVVLVPLTFKSMVAAENMKKLQPKMEEIRKKYEGDRERTNMELMKLYQEAKVNPLGGCLPLLLQMPVWIALFTTLRNSYEIYREPFFGPVWTDLTYKDPTYILPVLLGVTMIATQKLQPSMMDKAQQRIMTWFMPGFFTLLMLAYPAGLTLYIFTNNVLSIGQQYGIRKYLEHKGVAQKKAPASAAVVDQKKGKAKK
jgi:YidC/Oxa1 family membrane protein insertase